MPGHNVLTFPTQGINKIAARSSQPPGTSWDMQNVVPFDSSGRMRGAQRDGLSLLFNFGGGPITYIGQSTTTVATDTDPLSPIQIGGPPTLTDYPPITLPPPPVYPPLPPWNPVNPIPVTPPISWLPTLPPIPPFPIPTVGVYIIVGDFTAPAAPATGEATFNTFSSFVDDTEGNLVNTSSSIQVSIIATSPQSATVTNQSVTVTLGGQTATISDTTTLTTGLQYYALVETVTIDGALSIALVTFIPVLPAIGGTWTGGDGSSPAVWGGNGNTGLLKGQAVTVGDGVWLEADYVLTAPTAGQPQSYGFSFYLGISPTSGVYLSFQFNSGALSQILITYILGGSILGQYVPNIDGLVMGDTWSLGILYAPTGQTQIYWWDSSVSPASQLALTLVGTITNPVYPTFGITGSYGIDTINSVVGAFTLEQFIIKNNATTVSGFDFLSTTGNLELITDPDWTILTSGNGELGAGDDSAPYDSITFLGPAITEGSGTDIVSNVYQFDGQKYLTGRGWQWTITTVWSGTYGVAHSTTGFVNGLYLTIGTNTANNGPWRVVFWAEYIGGGSVNLHMSLCSALQNPASGTYTLDYILDTIPPDATKVTVYDIGVTLTGSVISLYFGSLLGSHDIGDAAPAPNSYFTLETWVEYNSTQYSGGLPPFLPSAQIFMSPLAGDAFFIDPSDILQISPAAADEVLYTMVVVDGTIWTGTETVVNGELSLTLNPASGTYTLAPTIIPGVTFSQTAGYIFDGTNALSLDLTTNTVTTFTATAGTAPSNCSVANLWLGRLILTGDPANPQNFYCSRIGVATDFDYTQSDNAAAFAGNFSSQGHITEPIVAICPCADDVMFMLGYTNMWVFRGDPTSGGTIDNISESIGILGPYAWCLDPSGMMYFVGSQGLFRCATMEDLVLARSGKPENLAGTKWQTYFGQLDPSLNVVSMVWDNNRIGCWIFVASRVSGTAATSLWYDARMNAIFPQQFPGTIGPLAAGSSVGNDFNTRAILIGGFDGNLYYLDPTAYTDGGIQIDAFVNLGPIAIGDEFSDGVINDIVLTFSDPNTDLNTPWNTGLQLIVATGRDAYSVTDGTPQHVAAINIPSGATGRIPSIRKRLRGAWANFKFAPTAPTQWGIESLAITSVPAGMTRR